MGLINEYLRKIKEAIYGEEVRGSIHDAIEQCYRDATGHPDSVAAIVEELIEEKTERKSEVDTERKRIDNLIKSGTAQTQEIGKVVLKTSYPGTEISMAHLSADIVYDKMFYNVSSIDANFCSIPYPQAGYVAKLRVSGLYHMKFCVSIKDTAGISETTMRIMLHSSDALDGEYTALKEEYFTFPQSSSFSDLRNVEFVFAITQPTYIKILVTSVADGSGTFELRIGDCAITAIDWRGKQSADLSELHDLRIGADGAVYSTAGDAVRSQACGVPRNLLLDYDYSDEAHGIQVILKGHEFYMVGTTTENGTIEILSESITNLGLEDGKTYYVYGFPTGTTLTFLSGGGICNQTQLTDSKLVIPTEADTVVFSITVKYKDTLNYISTLKICNREYKTYQEQIDEVNAKIDTLQAIITKLVTAPALTADANGNLQITENEEG